ncbi:FkbM family methyltransferase [Candidatus Methanoperedens nitratireducens]|uniref:Methyltransferase FkbM domain-containing protein n=1 Tax=Candidatus Methanoperedens nitratireducens TaxID=1392998 RepID=A0A284VNY6_9EURY|nr:FkbM family methyltransferase [Candidatus Methanoperedens nitroreducens]SNQ60938.1 conserved hypothetical protein [Candidatus Methanoperedens nitroreducens]
MKRIVKKLFNNIGFDITHLSDNPKYTLLGLRHLPICSVIDVGANEGQFARMISEVFPKANIYCFEPLLDPFKKLSKWAEFQSGRVNVSNIAIGDSEGDMQMFYHSEHSPSSSLLKSTEICKELYPFIQKQTPISVKLATLDKLMGNLSEPPIPDILIKLDVQGYEDRVIRGGAETFRRARACILEVNIGSLYENQASFKDILLSLDYLGYHYTGNIEQTYDNDGHVVFIDALFLK